MAIRVVMHNRSSTAIEMNTQTKCYIVTDLDNTLVGNTIATQEFNQKILNCGDRVGLIYATGRSYESAKQLQTTETLLEPQYWITGVGRECATTWENRYHNREQRYWSRYQVSQGNRNV